MSFFSYLTHGLSDILANFAPMVSNGAPIFLLPTPSFNFNENPNNANLSDPRLNLSPTQLSGLRNAGALQGRNPNGTITVPGPGGTIIPLGSGYQLTFDPSTTQGKVIPALTVQTASEIASAISGATQTFTGADVRLMIETSEPTADGRRYAKQLLEATTITVSVHREVVPVRASGYINPKGFALGKRTIAGTLILTQFTIDVLLEFMQDILLNDGSKDTLFSKVDQLPPFNITMIFCNEQGYASYRRLLGVKFVTDGTIYSMQDMMTEQTLSWMATDFTPLMSLNITSLFAPPDIQEPNIRSERTPMTAMSEISPVPPTPNIPAGVIGRTAITPLPFPTPTVITEVVGHQISFGDEVIGGGSTETTH